jgi:hypothetical protein
LFVENSVRLNNYDEPIHGWENGIGNIVDRLKELQGKASLSNDAYSRRT